MLEAVEKYRSGNVVWQIADDAQPRIVSLPKCAGQEPKCPGGHGWPGGVAGQGACAPEAADGREGPPEAMDGREGPMRRRVSPDRSPLKFTPSTSALISCKSPMSRARRASEAIRSRSSSIAVKSAAARSERQGQRALAGTNLDDALARFRCDSFDNAAQYSLIVQEVLAESLACDMRTVRRFVSRHHGAAATNTGGATRNSSSSQARNSCTDGLVAF